MAHQVYKIIQEINKLEQWEKVLLHEELVFHPYLELADEDNLIEAQCKLEDCERVLDAKNEMICDLQQQILKLRKKNQNEN